MNKQAVLHIPNSNLCYAYDANTYHLYLQTAKDDVSSVNIKAGDPYQWETGGGGGNLNADGAFGWVHETYSMTKTHSTDLFDYWFTTVSPPFKRLRYAFFINSPAEGIFYGESGFFPITNLPDCETKQLKHYFCLPFLNEVDVFQAPSWVKDTVWYQIFPERFNNGDESINPQNCLPWNQSEPKWDSFYGGDIKGIMDKLDYLGELGINGIYLCPIFKSPTNHKYDTTDYFDIDPSFGDKETFKQFVELAHTKGIKIMLDMVINHCGYLFEPWCDVIKNQEKSKFKDWFHIKSFPITPLASDEMPNYDTFAFVKQMPKMNTANEDVRNYFIDVATYWIREFDIDGWRLDVANEVDHAFWRDFRAAVKKEKEEVYILGEIWHNASPWLKGDQFDAVMNYPLANAVLDFTVKGKQTPTEFKTALTKTMLMYPQHVNDVNFNLLASHDTARILTLAKGNDKLLFLAYGLIFTLSGAPCIYYGDEIGITGGDDPGCRKCMDWDLVTTDNLLLNFFKKLLHLRHNIPALKSPLMRWLFVDDGLGLVVFEKCHPEGDVIVVVNVTPKETILPTGFFKNDSYTDLLTSIQVLKNNSVPVPAYGLLFLQTAKTPS